MTTTTARETTRGESITAREIDRQPAVWARTARIIADHREAVDAFVRPAGPPRRVVLTGAGTSAFAGEIAAPILARAIGTRVDAIATTSLVSNPREYLCPDMATLLVSFARSGNSPESLAATHVADDTLSDVRHLVITCDGTGALAREHLERPDSLVLVLPEDANDAAFAMTSSFTSMLLACLLVFLGAGAVDVPAAGAAARRLLDNPRRVVDLAATAPGRIVYLGSGPLTGLARESALKLLELTAGRVVTYFDSPLGFRHGPKAVLDPETLAVVYVSRDPYVRGYDEDIVAELRAALGAERVVVVAMGTLRDGTPPDIRLDDVGGVGDGPLALVAVLFAQLFALHTALRLGVTPDNPFPNGEVNRVVQGVRIHEFDPTIGRTR